MDNNKVFCTGCRYYKHAEITMSNKYLETKGPVFNHEISAPDLMVECSIGILQCTHDKCYDGLTTDTPLRYKQVTKTRIAGYAQLNRNNNCQYYKPSTRTKLIEIFNTIINFILQIKERT